MKKHFKSRVSKLVVVALLGLSTLAYSSSTVYYTPNGKKYHASKGCRSLNRSKTIYSGTISESRREACKVCY